MAKYANTNSLPRINYKFWKCYTNNVPLYMNKKIKTNHCVQSRKANNKSISARRWVVKNLSLIFFIPIIYFQISTWKTSKDKQIHNVLNKVINVPKQNLHLDFFEQIHTGSSSYIWGIFSWRKKFWFFLRLIHLAFLFCVKNIH